MLFQKQKQKIVNIHVQQERLGVGHPTPGVDISPQGWSKSLSTSLSTPEGGSPPRLFFITDCTRA